MGMLSILDDIKLCTLHGSKKKYLSSLTVEIHKRSHLLSLLAFPLSSTPSIGSDVLLPCVCGSSFKEKGTY